MKKHIRNSIFLKTISVIIAGIFLFNQVAWCAENLVDPTAQEQTETLPEFDTSQSTILEELISQKQAIEDFNKTNDIALSQEPEFQITTNDGDLISYAQGSLKSIEKTDGTVIENIVTDSNGDILDADITYPDKKELATRNGKVASILDEDGTRFIYNDDGYIEHIERQDGTYTAYLYEKNEDGEVIRTKVKEGNELLYYDKEQRLEKIEYTDGWVMEYKDGNVWRVKKEDDTAYYIKEGKVDSVVFSDGSVLNEFTLDEDGTLLTGIITRPGEEENKISYERGSANGNVIIKEGTKTYEYDACWKQILSRNGGREYKYVYNGQDEHIKTILTRLDGAVKEFDSAGRLKHLQDNKGTDEIYSYNTREEGILEVIKRKLYKENTVYERYYGNGYTDRNTPPYFKTIHRLNDDDAFAESGAYYYKSGDRCVDISVYLSDTYPNIDCYVYDYEKGIYDNTSFKLDLDVKRDTDYITEYIWGQEGVKIYVYEASLERPALPVYIIKYKEWDPRFFSSGNNTDVTVDGSSTGTFTRNKSVCGSFVDTLQGSAIHQTEFYIDNSSDNNTFYYRLTGGTRDVTYALSFGYENGDTTLELYSHKSTGETEVLQLPFEKQIKENVPYVFEMVNEDSTVNVYFYEKGTEKDAPIYTFENIDMEPQVYAGISGGDLEVKAWDDAEYYEYDAITGKVLKCLRKDSDEIITYEYGESGSFVYKTITLPEGTKRIYNAEDKLIKEETPCGEITVYGYGEDGSVKSIFPNFPEGTLISYYDDGSFEGKPEKVFLPDGDIIYYAYEITEEENLRIHKRRLYDSTNLYQGYCGASYIDHTLNPSLSVTFKLEPDKTYANFCAAADYYDGKNKSIGMSISVSDSKPYLSLYNCDTLTGNNVFENEYLDITADNGKEYKLEYLWTGSDIEVYIYESSESRPENPVYIIENAQWDPKFSVSGTNANIVLLNPSSTSFRDLESTSTDYACPLKKGPVYRTEFTFNDEETLKNLYYTASNASDDKYESIFISYYKGEVELEHDTYDYTTAKNTYEKKPIDIEFIKGKGYVMDFILEQEEVKVYFYEKGQDPGDPVYILEAKAWEPRIFARINGGNINTEAYDDLEIYEYNTKTNLLLDNDIPVDMRSKDFVIASQDKNIFPGQENDDFLGYADIDSHISQNLSGVYESLAGSQDVPLLLDIYEPAQSIETGALKGSIETVIGEIGTVEMTLDGIYIHQMPGGSKCSYKYTGEDYVINTSLDTAGTFTSYDYNEQGEYTGKAKAYKNGAIYKYDENNNLIEKQIPDEGIDISNYCHYDDFENHLSLNSEEINTWFKGTLYTYFESGNIHFKTISDGTVYEYFASENLKSKILPVPDENGNIKYEYYDEDFSGDHVGRISKIIKNDGSYEEFSSYFEGTELCKQKNIFNSNEELVEIHSFYKSGNLKSKVLISADENGNSAYEYLDEDYYGQHLGRVYRIIADNCSCEIFEEYWNDTENIKIKTLYDEAGVLEGTIYYDILGNEIKELKVTTDDPFYESSNSWGQVYDDMWAWKTIHAEEAWGLSTGKDIVIAVIDTGLDYNHPELATQLWHNTLEIPYNGIDDDGNGYVDDYTGWDFIGENCDDPQEDNDVMDGSGHGTHVAGIIAAEDNTEGIIGIAPNAKIMPIKVLDDNGNGYVNLLVKGIKYAVDMGAKIINMSLGNKSIAPSSLVDILAYAVEKGCLIIASAGNDGDDVTKYIPADMESVITIGSTGQNDTISDFSNYGDSIDFTAPGEDILSLRAENTDMYDFDIFHDHGVPQDDPCSQYYWARGTSMAAPFVSGIAALMLEQDHGLTYDDFMRRLKFSSVDLGDEGWDDYYGWGRVDAGEALTHDYDESGNVIKEWYKDPDTGEIKYRVFTDYFASGVPQYIKEYNSTGILLSTKEYDQEKSLIGICLYDSDGTLLSFEDMNENCVYLYDDKGNVHTKKYYTDNSREELEKIEKYEYDGDNVNKLIVFDSLNKTVTITGYYDYERGYITFQQTGLAEFKNEELTYYDEDLSEVKTLFSYSETDGVLKQVEHTNYIAMQTNTIDYYVVRTYDQNDNLLTYSSRLTSSEINDYDIINSKSVKQTYDEDGDIISVIDGEGKGYRIEYVKDENKNILQRTKLDLDFSAVSVEKFDVTKRLLESYEGKGVWNGTDGSIVIEELYDEPVIKNTYKDNEQDEGYQVSTQVKYVDDFGNNINYSETMVYDEQERVTKIIDKNGDIVEYVYNGDDIERMELLSSQSGENTIISYAYDNVDDNTRKVTKITNVYEDQDRTILLDEEIIAETYKKDSNDVVLSYIYEDESGETTTYEYYDDGSLKEIIYPDGKSESYVYTKDIQGTVLKTVLTVKELDIAGNETSYTEITEYMPDTGDIILFIDKAGNKTEYTYKLDSKGRLTQVRSSQTTNEGELIQETEKNYDAEGNCISIINKPADGDMSETVYSYYDDNTIKFVQYPSGEKIEYEYEYDDEGNLVKYKSITTDKDGSIEQYAEEYDSAGMKTRVIDEQQNEYITTYKKANTGEIIETIVTEKDKDGIEISVKKYDDRDNLISTKDSLKGITKNVKYIYANEYTSREYLETIEEETIQEVPGQDPLVITIQTHYDSEGNVIGVDNNGSSIVYEYYKENEDNGKKDDLKHMIDASGNKKEYLYEYDEEGFLKKKTTNYYQRNEENEFVFEYNEICEYDEGGRIISSKDKNDKETIYEYTFTNDIVTRIIETVDYIDGDNNVISYSVTKNYSDDGKQLLSETTPLGGQITYKYDEEGVLKSTEKGNSAISYSYDDKGRLISSDEKKYNDPSDKDNYILKRTTYFGEKDQEQIYEICYYSPGKTPETAVPYTTEAYYYDVNKILKRVAKKTLKKEYRDKDISAMDEDLYEDVLDTVYAVYNGAVKKVSESTINNKENFIYDSEGCLIESIITDGVYPSNKTRKIYNNTGDVIKIIKQYRSERMITDISYVKDNIGTIISKTETIKNEEYDDNGDIIDSSVLSKTEYLYYGSDPSDTDSFPKAAENHMLKTLKSGGKTHSYKYVYNTNGYIETQEETITWEEEGLKYTDKCYKKFSEDGDIIASIDFDGTYSEYEYSDIETGGRIQRQKLYYKLKDETSGKDGYENYKVETFDDVNTDGLVVSTVTNTYDFENDLVKVVKNYGEDGTDKITTSYSYEKDEFGNIVKKYEEVSTGPGVQIYEYDINGDLVAEIDRNGTKKKYKYIHDAVNGHITEIIEINSMYPDNKTVTSMDVYGNVLKVEEGDGTVKTYTYTKDSSGYTLSKEEKVRKTENDNIVISYTQEYRYYSQEDKNGILTDFTDKNGVMRNYEYIYDSTGTLTETYITVSWIEAYVTNRKYIKKTYNIDGTESSQTEQKDMTTTSDDHTVSYAYEYDKNSGVLIKVIETDSGFTNPTIYEYDLFGDIKTVTTPNGSKKSYVYEKDNMGYVIRKYTTNNIYPDLVEVEEYDWQGNKIKYIDTNGNVTTYTNSYDNKGNLVRIVENNSLYDNFKKITTKNVLGRITSIQDSNDVITRYSYETNKYGIVTKIYETDDRYGGEIIKEYDPVTSDVVSLTDRTGKVTSISYEYSSVHGGIVKRTETAPLEGEGTTIREFDNLNRIVTIIDRNGRSVSVDYEFDSYGNMLERKLKWMEDVNGINKEFIEEEYYSITGNLVKRIDNTGELTRYQYTRDDKGNVISVTSIECGTSDIEQLNLTTVKYDLEGRVASKTDPTGKTIYYNYVVDPFGQVKETYESLVPEIAVNVLVPCDIKDVNCINSKNSINGSYLYDENFNTKQSITWNSDGIPASLIVNLTDNNTNADNINGVGMAFRNGESYKYSYKIFYATAEHPENWIEIVDQSDKEFSRKDDWRIEKFDSNISAKYIRIQGAATSYSRSLEIEELKVYRSESRNSAIVSKTLDGYGRTITEKNALMLIWEERDDLKELFPDANGEATTGYWKDKKLVDWARMIGSWEDPRIAGYITNYDNKTFPAIEEAFKDGDITSSIAGITSGPTFSYKEAMKIIDGNKDTYGTIQWTDDNAPGYYTFELSDISRIDNIRLKMPENSGEKYAYNIYVSIDGVEWEKIITQNENYVSGWKENIFNAKYAKYIKIEGAGAKNNSSGYITRKLVLSELMIIDSTWKDILPDREDFYSKDLMSEWAKEAGFRENAELIKFAKTYQVTDEAETKHYTYDFDEKGNMSRMTEISEMGTIIRFYDVKGHVTEEIYFTASENNSALSERVGPDKNDSAFKRVYNDEGDLILEKNALAEVWENDAELRKYFITPDSTGIGIYSGWSLKKWANKEGWKKYSGLAKYNVANESMLNDLEDAYIAAYSYEKDDQGRIKTITKTTNFMERSSTQYSTESSAGELMDYILQEETQHIYSGKGYINGFGPSSIGGCNSNCWETYSTGGSRTYTLISTHIFEEKKNITQIDFKADISCSTSAGASQNTGCANCKVEWYDGSTWHVISGTTASIGCSGNGGAQKTVDISISVNLVGCEQIRAYLRARTIHVNDGANGGSEYADVKLYNISAKGLNTEDNTAIITSQKNNIFGAARKENSYTYYDNGNINKTTSKWSGNSKGDSYVIYDDDGNITEYKDISGKLYKYSYTKDEWNNIENIKEYNAKNEEHCVITDNKTVSLEEAKTRITEYYRAMLYREPTTEELTNAISVWEQTGLTNFVRDIIASSAEYKTGTNIDFETRSVSDRLGRLIDIKEAFTQASAMVIGIITQIQQTLTDISAGYDAVKEIYTAKKDKNDKKYIIEIYREELGRDAAEDELSTELKFMRLNKVTLAELREIIRDEENPDSEYNIKRKQIIEIINSLYNQNTGKGKLTDYIEAEDKYTYITEILGYDIKKELLVDLQTDNIEKIISWLKSQNNHFARSAVESLYKQIEDSGYVIERIAMGDSKQSIMNDLLTELLFIDIITGVINAETHGKLLISMHAVKKTAQKYGIDLIGTKYDIDTFLDKFNEIPGFSAIILYNGNHFLNVVDVIRDAEGNITHVKVVNGYINGIVQTKEIEINKFKNNYEGKLLSTERSDYDKRLTDEQLMTICGAGWWDKLWKAITKVFEGIVKAVKKVINYIIEPIVEFAKAIKYAVKEGKWGRVLGAVGIMVVGSVVAFFAGVSGAGYLIPTIFSTMVSMATSVCYGQYETAFTQLGVGIAIMSIQSVIKVGMDKVADKFKWDWLTDKMGKTVDVTKKTLVEQLATPGFVMDNAVRTVGYMGIGLVTGGVQRHITKQVIDSDNILARLGISILGASGIYYSGLMGQPNMEVSYALTEILLNATETIAMIEVNEEIEDEMGEEWYADFLRSSVNTVISSGFSVLKNSIHNTLMPKQDAIVVLDEKTGNPVILTQTNKKIEATNIVENSDGTKTATWDKLNVSVTYSTEGTISSQESRYFDFDEMMDYTKTAIFDDNGKIIDWEISSSIFEEKYSYLLQENWEDIGITSDNTIYLTSFLDTIKTAGGSYVLVTDSGIELSGVEADHYIGQYGLDGVNLYLTDAFGNKLSTPKIELYRETFSIDTSDMVNPYQEIPNFVNPYSYPTGYRESLINYIDSFNVTYWETNTLHNWNTYNGQGFGLDTRLGDGGIALISIGGDVGGIAGGLAIAGIGTVAVPISGGTSLVAVVGGGAITFFSGLNLIDDTYQLVNALGSSDKSYKDFTSYNWFFGDNAQTIKTSFSLSNFAGGLDDYFVILKQGAFDKITVYKQLLDKIANDGITIRSVRDYFRRYILSIQEEQKL